MPLLWLVGSGFVNVPTLLDCLFLSKDLHWDDSQHIQPLICFIGSASLLSMSKNTSLEVIMSHSWDSTATGGYFSMGSNDLLQKIRSIANDADVADTGLDYGVVKAIKLMNCGEDADRLSPCLSPAYSPCSSENLCKCQ